ncbi:MAG: ABC transporter ATP-binding protein [Ignisphaera sp.]|nr:ABC transporter ATP-binding protein [Ignisphaera sp.]
MGRADYPALRGVSMDVKKSEFLCIIGASSSGKSTLLNIMGALDKPTRGEVFFEKSPLSKLSSDKLAELRNRRIGFEFQTFNLISHLTAAENVELPMIALGAPPRKRRERAIEVLSRFLPQSIFSKRSFELSGGEQQRIAIARALANNPDVMLADEPTGNLDSTNANLIARIFRELRDEGRTVVMVTHNIELTAYAYRIVKLRDGQIVEIIYR